jgi:hypothetical protein
LDPKRNQLVHSLRLRVETPTWQPPMYSPRLSTVFRCCLA